MHACQLKREISRFYNTAPLLQSTWTHCCGEPQRREICIWSPLPCYPFSVSNLNYLLAARQYPWQPPLLANQKNLTGSRDFNLIWTRGLKEWGLASLPNLILLSTSPSFTPTTNFWLPSSLPPAQALVTTMRYLSPSLPGAVFCTTSILSSPNMPVLLLLFRSNVVGWPPLLMTFFWHWFVTNPS